MDDWEIGRLASRATFLHERLIGGWTPDAGDDHLPLAQRRLEYWRQLAAGGDWDRFRQRLAWDGLDEAAALALLRPGCLAEVGDPPRWTEILAAALAEEAGSDLAAAFVSVAETLLAQAAGDKTGWLSPPARQRLTGYLTDRLAGWIEPVFTQPGWAGVEIQASPHPLHALAAAYPVLARQLATRAIQWVDETADFLARLGEDWPALAQPLGLSAALTPGMITGLRPGLSDPHQGGRTVWQVTFAPGPSSAHGLSVAYKPKDLSLDRAWADLVDWVTGQGLADGPGRLWTLPRTGYGWMAWAEAPTPRAPRHDPSQMARRMGGMLALLHLLHAADCHAENLLIRQGAPLLLDAEMLCYPQFTGQEAADPLDVMRTGLLPRWQVTQAGATLLSGLDPANLDPGEVAAGFQAAQEFLAHHWPQLSGARGPLAPFRRGRVRVAARPTAAYLRLLDHLRHPAFLADGADFSIETERLAHTYLHRPDRAHLWPLLAEEHRAVAQGDVPIFTARIGSPDLSGAEGTVHHCLTWPPFAQPDPTAQSQQTGLIRASLDRSPYLSRASDSFLEAARGLGHLLARRAVPRTERGLGGSKADHGKIRAHPPNPRPISWLAPQFQPKSGLYQHGLIGDDLYAGRAGIALFLAGLARVTGEAMWGELARAGLAGADGAAVDPGGRIYALSLAGTLLDAPDLLAEASTLARTASEVDQAGVLDGQAGMALGLLALYRATGDRGALAQATSWGERLLAGEGEWGHAQRGLGGFSHGGAGIAHALARIYGASRETRFRDGAIRAWAFQQRLFDKAAGNWQDRRGEQPVYLRNWCNGAAGIGLAAAGGLGVLPGAAAAAERAADLLAPPFLDTLCCGGFGQIDCLLEMGRLLGRQDWIDQATVRARRTLDRATSAGHFRLYDDLPAHLFNPGFFRGVAGIGYSLLRLAAAKGEGAGVLPCVLGMEIGRLGE